MGVREGRGGQRREESQGIDEGREGRKACRQRRLVGFPAAQTKTITQKLY